MRLFLTALLLVGLARAASAGPSVSAVSSQPVHPVLIRNEHGPLTRVVVTVENDAAVRATAFVFRLAGTDDLHDLDSLSLFSTGDKETFSAVTPVGEPVQPAMEVTFRGDRPLTAGKNVFWLSCRLKPSANLAHRVAASCSAIETSVGKITPRDDSPGARQRIGVALRRHKDDGVHTYRIPALTTSAKGTLLCVYDMRRRMGRDLQEDIDIGLSRSIDGGRTWEPVRVIMDRGEFGGLPPEQNGCSDPGIIVDRQTGEIFCFAVWMHGKPGKHQWNDDGSEPGFEIGTAAQFLMVRSRDDGLTWSKPENLTRRLKQEAWWLLVPSPQSGINLPDGTLVMPVQGRTGRERGQTFATLMISRDHGTTWTIAQPGYTGGNECQAARLGDGSIMLNIRNDRERFRAVVVTKDLGQTWEPHPTSRNTLIEPNCNGSLLRVDYVQSGEKKHLLLFANPHSQQSRTQHTIQVSFDDGLTWPKSHHRLLDEGRGAGYPSLTQIDSDHVGIVYEGSQSHLVFEKFTIAELLQPAASDERSARDANDDAPVERRVRIGKVDVALSPAVIVALSAVGEQRWGQHQFPALSRFPDGRLWLTDNASVDRDDAYGHPGPEFVSADQGRTWTATRPDDPLLAISHSVVSPVHDGEFLCVPMSPSLSIDREKLRLPEPAAKFNVYGEVLQFRLGDCPPRVSEFLGTIPAVRWRPADRTWRREDVAWDTAGAFVRTRRSDFVFSRPYLDNAVVRIGERLLYAGYLVAYPLPDGSQPKNYAAWCMESVDNGRTWRRLGLIAHDGTGDVMMGEPSLVMTPSGDLACLIRGTDHRQRPLLITHSRDGGRTWEPTRELFPFGVMPQTLRLNNGVVAASFGRPGVHLAFAEDAAARRWSPPLPLIAGDAKNVSAHSCGYTRLVPLDDRSFLIAYSDFQFPDERGQRRRAILVRRIAVDQAPGG